MAGRIKLGHEPPTHAPDELRQQLHLIEDRSPLLVAHVRVFNVDLQLLVCGVGYHSNTDVCPAALRRCVRNPHHDDRLVAWDLLAVEHTILIPVDRLCPTVLQLSTLAVSLQHHAPNLGAGPTVHAIN